MTHSVRSTEPMYCSPRGPLGWKTHVFKDLKVLSLRASSFVGSDDWREAMKFVSAHSSSNLRKDLNVTCRYNDLIDSTSLMPVRRKKDACGHDR